MFSRICFHYSMNYWQVMNLPIRVFWLFNRNLGRILAEKDLRALSVTCGTQSGDEMKKVQDRLVIEMDGKHAQEEKSLVTDDTRDEKGFEELRSMVR